MEIGKKDKLEQGYIYVPYLFATTNNIISDGGMGSVGKNYIRKDKLNKIFNLGYIIDSGFSPKVGIKSRYSTVKVNNHV